ncbi:MAG: hypothetical protein KAS21_05585 [Candidatus Aminicenantes bacterium]|nr:hypothetical protein [Candidatus Aminicenantes bacterium]MCK5004536.1 hypothetical protein [Candidatus Aminicenantes bacterium]
MTRNIRAGNFKEKLSGFFFFSGLILIFLFLTLFAQFLHNHSILESEDFDCPLYLFSSQSLMSVAFVFVLLLILVEILREIYTKVFDIHSILILLPANKSPPC